MDIDMTTLRLVEHERGIDLDTLVGAIEQALVSAYHRTPGAHESARVEVDRRTGHVTVWARERLEGDPAHDPATTRSTVWSTTARSRAHLVRGVRAHA